MICREYIHLLQLVNTLFCIGGMICAVYGGSTVPQTVSNSNNRYIGDSSQFNEDLKQAQMNSYGFKLVIIGLSITGGNVLSLVLACCYLRYEDNHSIHPAPITHTLSEVVIPPSIQVPADRRVTISPMITEIPFDTGADKD